MNQVQIQRQTLKWLERFQQSTIISPVIRQLLQSTQQQSWYILDQCIDKLMISKQRQTERALEQLHNQVDKISTFPMMLYIYSLRNKYNITMLKYAHWKTIYKNISVTDNGLLIFNSWISDAHKFKVVQESLQMVITNFLLLFKTEYTLTLSQKQLQSAIYWLSYFNTTDSLKFNIACGLAKYMKQNPIDSQQYYLPRDHLMLKKIIEIIGMSSYNTGNIFLCLHPMTFKEKQLEYFCNYVQTFLLGLVDQHVLNVFLGLTKVVISKQILMILDKLSRLFLSSEQFFKLRVVYQSVILPRIVKRSKSCSKLCQPVLQLASFYVMGFMNHCDIGKEGMECILKNIGKIKNMQIQKKWVNLCGALISKYPNYEEMVITDLRKQKVIKERQIIDLNEAAFQLNEVWIVTARTGRKHKIYPKTQSKIYKGIQNQSNDCYIISVVQALYMTAKLYPLLYEHKSTLKEKYPLLAQLHMLFRELSGKSKTDKVSVKYLKNKGSITFVESHFQQDAQQYLTSLFDQIQKSLKDNEEFLRSFKKLFEVSFITKIVCKQCEYTQQREQKQYVITIQHDQILQQKYLHEIEDYKCEYCHKMKATMEKTLKPNSQTMIVHISRFQHAKGTISKLLSTQTIQRKIMGYELKGIIFHFGRGVQRGHYTYYAKIARNKWVEMNDGVVNQFTLDKEDQQFERQMKTDMTPYMLFYTKIQEAK